MPRSIPLALWGAASAGFLLVTCTSTSAAVGDPEPPMEASAVATEAAAPAPTIARPAMDWVPSPHFRRGTRTPATVDAIAIHTTEGTYDESRSHAENQARNYRGTVDYFEDNDRNVSAHFLLGPGGEITQMVAEDDIAHTTTYYNARSFGIECAGWSGRAETWTPELLDSLVELCAYLAVTWDIEIVHPEGTAYTHGTPTDDPERPRFDAPGIVGHFQVQPWNKSDPGPHFPWQAFLARLRERVDGLRPAPGALLQPPVVRRQQWGAGPVRSGLREHDIDRITIHHSGVAVPDWPAVDGVAWMQHLQRFSLQDRPWPDVPYHFSVMPDGTVYQGRDPRFAGDTNTGYDPAGHLLIEAVGHFGRDEVPDTQLEAVVSLAAWASSRYGVDPGRIGGHGDYADTTCPGESLHRRVVSGEISARVEERLAAVGAAGPR